MPEDDEKQAVEMTPKLHGDADFMAAIDEQMEALKAKKKKATRKRTTTTKPQTTKKKAVPKPQPEETVEEPAEDPSEEDEGEVVTVKTSAKKNEEETPVEATEKPKALSHSGKTIQPVTLNKPKPKKAEVKSGDDYEGEATSVRVNVAPSTTKETAESKEPKEQQEKEPADDESKPQAKEEEPAEETKEVPNEGKTETIKTTSREKPTLETSELSAQIGGLEEDNEDEEETDPDSHVIKTFDTTKYHLPIKPTRHHRKHSVHPATVILLLIALVAVITVVAIDMEILDVGYKLPFDFL